MADSEIVDGFEELEAQGLSACSGLRSVRLSGLGLPTGNKGRSFSDFA